MKKIKICVVGAGGIADRRTIPAMLLSDKCELSAVMDRVPEVAKSIGEKYGVPYYSDEEEMLKNTSCDAVYISTPVFCHKEQAEMAIKYGKHIFLEKPITIHYGDAKELLEKSKASGLQLEVGYMMKYNNLHVKAKELVKAGKIGQVTDVRLQFSCWYPDIKGAWRQNKELGGGGALMDLAVHCFELAENVLDDKIDDAKCFMSTRTFSYEVEDCAVIIFRTEKGVLGHIDVNFNIPDLASESKFEIYGTDGYYIMKGTLGQEENGEGLYLYAPQGDYSAQQNRVVKEPEKFTANGRNIYLIQLDAFCDKILSGTDDYSDALRAVNIQKICDSLYNYKN